MEKAKKKNKRIYGVRALDDKYPFLVGVVCGNESEDSYENCFYARSSGVFNKTEKHIRGYRWDTGTKVSVATLWMDELTKCTIEEYIFLGTKLLQSNLRYNKKTRNLVAI